MTEADKDELIEARAEIARLREALRPFAQEHSWGPHSRFKIVLAGPEGDITGSDLDRARAALAPRDAKQGMRDGYSRMMAFGLHRQARAFPCNPRETPNPRKDHTMKLTTILTAVLLGGVAFPTLAFADAPVFPGAAATPCDPDRFTPIFGKDGVTVLYWNNPTCVYGGSDAPNAEPEEEEVVEEPEEPTEPETDEA